MKQTIISGIKAREIIKLTFYFHFILRTSNAIPARITAKRNSTPKKLEMATAMAMLVTALAVSSASPENLDSIKTSYASTELGITQSPGAQRKSMIICKAPPYKISGSWKSNKSNKSTTKSSSFPTNRRPRPPLSRYKARPPVSRKWKMHCK